MHTLLFITTSIALSSYPISNTNVTFGMSEADLVDLTNAYSVSDNDFHGRGYSEIFKENPKVYAEESSTSKKTEYYFHDKQLYKIATIFHDQVNDHSFYLEKLNEIKNTLGEPQRHYQDNLFSMPIEHYVWESREEQLDLRYGAGHVYEVRIQKALQKDKIRQEQLINSI